MPSIGLEPQTFRMQKRHFGTELRRQLQKDAIYLNSYTQSEILDEIKIYAMPKENSVSKSRKKIQNSFFSEFGR